MDGLPRTPDLVEVARRTVWFKEPEDALGYEAHFIAHVLTYGTAADTAVLRRHVSDERLRWALRNAPPGIFDARSWYYWHLILDEYPPPAMPERALR